MDASPADRCAAIVVIVARYRPLTDLARLVVAWRPVVQSGIGRQWGADVRAVTEEGRLLTDATTWEGSEDSLTLEDTVLYYQVSSTKRN